MKIYKCDNKDCVNKSNNSKKWITIGSKNGSELNVENRVLERNVIVLDNHTDIHFCSKECMVKYFFI